MKKKTYREVDFATALYEQTHKGAVVEWRASGSSEWANANGIIGWGGGVNRYRQCEWRIVTETEPKYREYQKVEEVPVGRIATYTWPSGATVRGVLGVTKHPDKDCDIHIGAAGFAASSVLKNAKFDDSSPCGVEVVE